MEIKKYTQKAVKNIKEIKNMGTNRTNTYVNVTACGGIDWHDYRTTETFLQENGKYEIQDAEGVIAGHIHQELSDMVIDTQHNGKTRLRDIPDTETIKAYIQNKEPFTVTSENGDLEASWHPEKSKLIQYYMFGQVTYDLDYGIKNIAPEDVIYFAVENFLAISKGIPSIQRFYRKPFTDLETARTALKELRTHDGRCPNGIVKELLIADRNEITQTDWYKFNMQVIDILTAHPELDTEDNFECNVIAHIEKLEKIPCL